MRVLVTRISKPGMSSNGKVAGSKVAGNVLRQQLNFARVTAAALMVVVGRTLAGAGTGNGAAGVTKTGATAGMLSSSTKPR